jgi:hypothetical protein
MTDLSVNLLLVVTGQLLELRLVNRLQLRAAQLADEATNCTCECVEWAEKNVWLGLSGDLVDEAAKVVALKQSLRVEDTASQITNVNTSEGVGCASVTVSC